MKLTLEKAKQMLEQNNNSLYLSGTQIVNKKAQEWRVKN